LHSLPISKQTMLEGRERADIGLEVDCEKKLATPHRGFDFFWHSPYPDIQWCCHQEVLSQRNAGERSGKENYHFQ
jgi:hypothetical protein